MKKRAEWPWFVVPFVLLPLVAFGCFGIRLATTEASIIGGSTYIQLLLSDKSMRLALLNGCLLYCGAGAVLGSVVALPVWLVGRGVKLSRRWKFVLVFSLVGLFTRVGLLMIHAGMNEWEAQMVSLLVANAAALFVWLAEKAAGAIRNRKQMSEVE